MPVNNTGNGTGRLELPNTQQAKPVQTTPAPAPVAPAPAAPALPAAGAATDAANMGANADLIGQAAQAHYSPVPWAHGLGAVNESFKELKDAMTKDMSGRQIASLAASGLSTMKSAGDVVDSVNEFRDGDYFGAATDGVKGLSGMASGTLKMSDAITDTKQHAGTAANLKAVGIMAGSVSNTVDGFNELRNGDYMQGGAHLAEGLAGMGSSAASLRASRVLAQAAADGKALGLADDALESFKRNRLMGSFGNMAAPLAIIGGGIGGAMTIGEGISQIRNGDVLEGSLTIGQGTLDTLASTSYVASVLPTASSAIETFGKAAGPLGAAAGIVGGGIQVYHALNGNPPDYSSAAVGGAKAVGSALLLTPPPGDIAGGAILIGAALYENVTPVKEVVDGAVVGAIDVGKGVVEGVEDLAEGVNDAGHHLAEGVSDAGHELAEGHVVAAATELAGGAAQAASDVGHAAAEAVSDVADGIEKGAERLGEGLAAAGDSINNGVHAVGDFIGGLF